MIQFLLAVTIATCIYMYTVCHLRSQSSDVLSTHKIVTHGTQCYRWNLKVSCHMILTKVWFKTQKGECFTKECQSIVALEGLICSHQVWFDADA